MKVMLKLICILPVHSVQQFLVLRFVKMFTINLLKVDGVDDVKVNVSNHFMAEQINNQVNNSPNPKKQG